jgi:dihydroorotase
MLSCLLYHVLGNYTLQSIKISKPNNWHVHFQDDNKLSNIIDMTVRYFSHALLMFNVKHVLTSIKIAIDYCQSTIMILSDKRLFILSMTLYLNEQVGQNLMVCAANRYIIDAKFYPASVTIHFDEIVQSLMALYLLEKIMQTHNLVVPIHKEVVYADIFTRKKRFITYILRS